MARGNWRNWESLRCPKCGFSIYIKDIRKGIKNRLYEKDGKYFCSKCNEELKEES